METKAYKSLLEDNSNLYMQAYGNGYVLGIQGNEKEINMFYNMIYNFSFDKRCSSLNPLWENLSYLYITPENLKKVLFNFLSIRSEFDNENISNESIHILVEKFFELKIVTRVFMPEPTLYAVTPYRHGWNCAEASPATSPLEELIKSAETS